MIGAGTAALILPGLSFLCKKEDKVTHIVSLSFDDGFKTSFLKTAEIYEKHGLYACFNVLSSAHLPGFDPPDAYILSPLLGDFGLWNELQQRGHEIMPHGYRHANLPSLPIEEAQDLVLRCLDYFVENLDGFNPREAVFNFPFNLSSPELEEWVVTQVKAFRTGGDAVNPLPYQGQVRLTCQSYGPDNMDTHLEGVVENFLARENGWLIFNTHGLDEEGWGPMSSTFLDRLLEDLSGMETVRVIPVGTALNEMSSKSPF